MDPLIESKRGLGVGGRSLLKFDDDPGMSFSVEFASGALLISVVGGGYLGERSGSSGLVGRGVLAADVMTCRVEVIFRAGLENFGGASDVCLELSVELRCPYVFVESVKELSDVDKGFKGPKAIGKRRLLVDNNGLTSLAPCTVDSASGACDRRKPI